MRSISALATAMVLALTPTLTLAPTAARAAWDETYFPNYPLVSQDGQVFNFYDDLIDGKIVVVDFIYTSCPDICGLSTARLSWVRDELGDRIGKDIFIYSISLDPANDTPEKLKEYSDAFGRSDGWLFLTGRPEHIDEIRYKLGERSRKLNEHRSDMAIGNGSTGQWRRTSLMGNLTMVARDILELDPEFHRAVAGKQPVQTGTHSTGLAWKDAPGQSLFLKACAACHTVGGGVRIGPDLMDVTLRRDREWLLRAMTDPDELRKAGDPAMTALDAQFPGVVMPDLDLSVDDAGDILLYLAERSAAVKAANGGVHIHTDGTHHDHGAPALPQDDAHDPAANNQDAHSANQGVGEHVAHASRTMQTDAKSEPKE